LDKKDEALVRVLERKSGLSNRSLSKMVGLPISTVHRRVKKMEREGIIKGYTTITDPDRLEYYPLCLRISAEPGTDLSKIGQRIAENDSVNVVLRVSGECELLALAMCGSRDAALKLLDEINDVSGIQKAESHVVLEAIKLGGIKIK